MLCYAYKSPSYSDTHPFTISPEETQWHVGNDITYVYSTTTQICQGDHKIQRLFYIKI